MDLKTWNQDVIVERLILDVDGVLTDGRKIRNLAGHVVGKQFFDRDFTHINEFRRRGVQVLMLSGDNRVNRNLAADKKIQFIHAPPTNRGDRGAKVRALCAHLRISTSEDIRERLKSTAFVGDDLADDSLLSVVGFPFCPSDAAPPILARAKAGKVYKLRKGGGRGVVEDMYYTLLAAGRLPSIRR